MTSAAMPEKKVPTWKYHRFLDEAGDTAFYGKGNEVIVGQEGVSKCFILGMLSIKEPLDAVRERVTALQQAVATDPYYRDIPSIQKKVGKYGYYLHAKDDVPEVRKQAFELIASIKCSFQAVVARKIPDYYERKHQRQDAYLYADLLSHLLKDKVQKYSRLVLNISQRGSTTSHVNLTRGLVLARQRYEKKHWEAPEHNEFVFNVQSPTTEPLLNLSDYFCWAVQRVFERGEVRYYDYVKDKVSTIHDLYDVANYEGYRNYYNPRRPLTQANKLP